MPVVDRYRPGGGPTTSTVRLITDEKSGVALYGSSSRAQSMLMGSASRQITLNLVTPTRKVAVSVPVVTSGLEAAYSLRTSGKVTNVEAAQDKLYYTIVVEPYGNVSTNER